MKVGPANPAAHLLSRLEQVMMIVPIDADANEAEHCEINLLAFHLDPESSARVCALGK